MKRYLFGMTALVALLLLVTAHGVSQPPGGREGPKAGPPRFELGQVFPPPLLDELNLTPEQQKELGAIRKDLKAKFEKLLTDEQKKKAENFRPHGPAQPGGKGPPPVEPAPEAAAPAAGGARLLTRGKLKVVGAEKAPFTLTGDVLEGVLGDFRREPSGNGVRLLSGEDVNKDGVHAGSVACTVNGLNAEKGRWYHVRLRGLAQENFAVENGAFFVQVEFFKDGGKNPLDHVKKSLYAQVELERKALADAGTNKNLGPATWRDYAVEVHTPFPEVDTLCVSVGFNHGVGKGPRAEFWIAEVEVAPVPDPADYLRPVKPGTDHQPPALKLLVKLGGRWYFDPRGGSKEPPAQFDHTNADQLYYLTDRLETPFAGNTSAWLRRGYLDRENKFVEKDQFVPDAVVLSFTDKHLVMKSKNLPNHPTAVFPDRSRFLDGNPHYIKEQRDTWFIPLEPQVNPKHVAMTEQNHRALPMGPIGVALNGVVFFNPFDADATDAVWRLDRCCGHPSPRNEYHYHKYPACVNSPWADDGTGHSPLIGFAFDGFPVYGPYESAGVLAKDARDHPLNAFNLHEDEARGPHYHVTPGKFPHLLGGYWGDLEPKNRPARQGPPRE